MTERTDPPETTEVTEVTEVTEATDAAAPPTDDTSRRDLFIGAGVGVAAGTIGTWLAQGWNARDDSPATPQDATPASISASGNHQAGVAEPANPQSHSLMTVLSILDHGPAVVGPLLAELGRRILHLTHPEEHDLGATPDGPGDLTIHVGLGPAPLAAVDPDLEGARAMPLFVGDEALLETHLNGDLLIAAHASDPGILEPVRAALLQGLDVVAELWSEHGVRGPSERGIVRNPLGYHDGIIIPRDEELDDPVWFSEGPLAGGTICVIRKLRIDIDRFWNETAERQDEVVGRRKVDGVPLSGGAMEDEVNLLTKRPTGEFLTPARSHTRAAHPSFTGSPIMLRRSYGYFAARQDRGLLFTCFQRELKIFVLTQQRMDEVDDLLAYTTTVASGSWVILPGFSEDRALGSTLYA